MAAPTGFPEFSMKDLYNLKLVEAMQVIQPNPADRDEIILTRPGSGFRLIYQKKIEGWRVALNVYAEWAQPGSADKAWERRVCIAYNNVVEGREGKFMTDFWDAALEKVRGAENGQRDVRVRSAVEYILHTIDPSRPEE